MTKVDLITYYRQNNDIEYIYYKNFSLSYPMHTHANHITIGYITDGRIYVICNGKERLYHAGEFFCILPDVLHAVKAVDDTTYSMISICIPIDKTNEESFDKISYSRKLKQMILQSPENGFSIEDMSECIGISPYHMIRQFKSACGLTPHQFQIQCRVRKAQRLLEEGKSMTEAAYATGFCDQSHFSRCFHKIIRLTPSEYKQAVKRLI